MWSLVDWFLSSASRILATRQFHHLQKFIFLAVLNATNFHHASPVPYVVRGKLTEEGGMALSSGGVGGAASTGEPFGEMMLFCCLVTKSCPNLCDPMDWSTPGFPVHHQLPEFAQTHIH